MFVKTEPAIRPLIEYLKEQNSLLDSVAVILGKEIKALTAKDYNSIETLAEEKSKVMLRLQSNDQKIRLHPDSEELKSTFLEHVLVLKQKLFECKKKNMVNGRLIDMDLASNRRLFAVLMGARDKATRNMTYNDKGTTTATGPLRVSIEA